MLLFYFRASARGLFSRNARGLYKEGSSLLDIDKGVPFPDRSPSARLSVIHPGASAGKKALPEQRPDFKPKNSTLCAEPHQC